MKKLLALTLCLLLYGTPAMADDKALVEGLLKEKIGLVISLLKEKDMEKKVKDEKIIAALTPIFDFNLMAKLSLGKKYWPGLSSAQQSEFSDLFTKRLQESYLEKFGLYSDEEAVYEEATVEKNKIYIKSSLVSPDNRIDMFYKFYMTKEGWKIYDVEIQGVSIIQTYRSQFDGVLKDGTIDTLIAKLSKQGEFTIPTGGK